MRIITFVIIAGMVFFPNVQEGNARLPPMEDQVENYQNADDNGTNMPQTTTDQNDFDENTQNVEVKHGSQIHTHAGRDQKIERKPAQYETMPEPHSRAVATYYASNMVSLKVTRQEHPVILIDKLNEFEKEHLPVTVTYDTDITPVGWFHDNDITFRMRATKILNMCHELKKWHHTFLPEDAVHASISPYLHHGHLSVTIFILDPYAPDRNVFIAGSTIFKCFKRDLGQFERVLDGNITGCTIGLSDYEYFTLKARTTNYSMAVGFLIMGVAGTIIGIAIVHYCKRSGRWVRLADLRLRLRRGIRNMVPIPQRPVESESQRAAASSYLNPDTTSEDNIVLHDFNTPSTVE